MRFSVTLEFWLDVKGFDEAYGIYDAARDAVVEIVGDAAAPGGESQAVLMSDLVPVDEAASEPVVGMSLMYGYELLLRVVEGGTLALRKL